MGQSVLYLMPPVTSSRCSEAHGIGKGTAFHRGLERGEIVVDRLARVVTEERGHGVAELTARRIVLQGDADDAGAAGDRKSTRLNSSHRCISYAVFCLKKKNRDMWGVKL